MAIAPLNKLFDAATPTTWAKIRELYANVKANAKTELVTRLTSAFVIPELQFFHKPIPILFQSLN